MSWRTAAPVSAATVMAPAAGDGASAAASGGRAPAATSRYPRRRAAFVHIDGIRDSMFVVLNRRMLAPLHRQKHCEPAKVLGAVFTAPMRARRPRGCMISRVDRPELPAFGVGSKIPAMKFLDPDTELPVRDFLARIPAEIQLDQAILFGSRARGEHRPDSDADVALILHESIRGPRRSWRFARAT